MATENPFVKLFAIDFKDHLEVKKSGNTELKYVSWAYAWAEVKKLCLTPIPPRNGTTILRPAAVKRSAWKNAP